MNVVGLTGSIGTGKSTTAEMFRRFGVPVHDSDGAVHRLYNGPGALAVEAMFPGVVEAGRVNRTILAQRVLGNPGELKKLQDLIHPLVADDRDNFLVAARNRGESTVVLDIPLLFEIGGLGSVDVIVVVSAPEDVQKSRVLAREGMTVEKFAAIMARQVPDAMKRRACHFLVDTGRGLGPAEAQVRALLKSLRFRRNIRDLHA